jgi:putative transposase
MYNPQIHNAYYKYKTTKLINEIDDTLGSRIWQRNYYDHIIS